jgi:hypothetical protein
MLVMRKRSMPTGPMTCLHAVAVGAPHAISLAAWAALSVSCAATGTWKRDPHPPTFRAGHLNDRRADLFDRPPGIDTPSAFASASSPPRSLRAGEPRLVGPIVRVVPNPRAEVPPWSPPATSFARAPLPAAGFTAPGSGAAVLPPAPPPIQDEPPSAQPLPDVREPRNVVAPSALASWLRHGENPTLRRQRIAAFAASLVGSRRVVVNGRRYANNCSDFVRAVYAIEGIDLYRWPSRPKGFSGVRGVYGLARLTGALHFRPKPEMGDVVFFHHTYDFNRNRRIDDYLSHIGVVERVDPDGTVHYIDRSGGRVRRGKMNVRRPHLWRDPHSLKLLNSYLRRRKKIDPPGTRYLAGDLFAGFGTLIR